jgi:hypothetical protein
LIIPDNTILGNTPEELFSNVINSDTSMLEWPNDDDELVYVPDDAKNLIECLLQHDPMKRLGANGALEIKQHLFFTHLNWNNLLLMKADFVPQLDGPDDTSYFDTRSERYDHASTSSSNHSSRNGVLSSADSESSSPTRITAAYSIELTSSSSCDESRHLKSSRKRKSNKKSKSETMLTTNGNDGENRRTNKSRDNSKNKNKHLHNIRNIVDDNIEEENLMDKLNILCLSEYELDKNNKRSNSSNISNFNTKASSTQATMMVNGESNNDELDENELFPSFSSCSSKFRFSRSNSNANSPILSNSNVSNVVTDMSGSRQDHVSITKSIEKSFNLNNSTELNSLQHIQFVQAEDISNSPLDRSSSTEAPLALPESLSISSNTSETQVRFIDLAAEKCLPSIAKSSHSCSSISTITQQLPQKNVNQSSNNAKNIKSVDNFSFGLRKRLSNLPVSASVNFKSKYNYCFLLYMIF